jgi:cell division septum initiation protein DivIVA
MSDTPIMSWEQADQIIKDQRAEIERLREAIRRLADQDATLSVRDGNVTVEMDATLTDAEREAMSAAACICEDAGRTEIAVVINTALERLG